MVQRANEQATAKATATATAKAKCRGSSLRSEWQTFSVPRQH